MTASSRQPERRAGALTRTRIVEAAVVLLDRGGEEALTFRALAASLATGSGAIYWHVTDKEELLAAAADEIIARAMAGVSSGAEPRGTIRAFALMVFDEVDVHPWIATQMIREPWRPAMTALFETIGASLLALGVPEDAQFDAWSALVGYVVGVAVQNVANTRMVPHGTDRMTYLEATAARWEALDPSRYPFMARLATRLRDHDDRDQFVAGLDLILDGICAVR